MSSPIRVVLADDHVMVREALAQILKESGRISIVGQAGDGREVFEILAKTPADVVVLDYTMPAGDAPDVIERLARRYPKLKVLVLTVHASIHYAVKVFEAGAHGFVIKSAALKELADAIEAVYRGDVHISPRVSGRVIQHLRRPKKHRVGLEALSQREFEFLRCIGSGMSLTACAKQLGISTSTASTYRARLMEKLNLHTTAEIIRFALEQEIVG